MKGEGEKEIRKIYNIPADIPIRKAEIKLTKKQEKDFVNFLNDYGTISLKLNGSTMGFVNQLALDMFKITKSLKKAKSMKQLQSIKQSFDAIEETSKIQFDLFNKKYPRILKNVNDEVKLFVNEDEKTLIYETRANWGDRTISYSKVIFNDIYNYLKEYFEKKNLFDQLEKKGKTVEGKAREGLPKDIVQKIIKPMIGLKNKYEGYNAEKITDKFIKDTKKLIDKYDLERKDEAKFYEKMKQKVLNNTADISSKIGKLNQALIKDARKVVDFIEKAAKEVEEREKKFKQPKSLEEEQEEEKKKVIKEEPPKQKGNGMINVSQRIIQNRNRF